MLSGRLRNSLLKRTLKTKLAFGLKEALIIGGGFGGLHGAAAFDPQRHRGKSRAVSTALGAAAGAGTAALVDPLARAALRAGLPPIPVVLGSAGLDFIGSTLPTNMYLKSKPKQTHGGSR